MNLDSFPGRRPATQPVSRLEVDTRRDLSSMRLPCGPGSSGSIVDYEAIKDYIPSYFSRSGRPHLDLRMYKGDVVQVLGMGTWVAWR